MYASTLIYFLLLAASTAVSVYGQQQAANAQEDAAAAAARQANAQAKNKEQETAEAIRRERTRQRRHMASIRTRLSANGTDTTSGTPLLLLGEAAANFDLAIQDAKRSADWDAYRLRQSGQMALWQADQYSTAADTQSFGTALQGLSSLSSAYSGSVASGSMPDTFGLYSTSSGTRV